MRTIPFEFRLFIAYPFQPEAQAIVDQLVKPVLSKNNVAWITGENVQRPQEELIETLKRSISSCSALVAFMLGPNANVFFEIGLASALGKPCLFLVTDESDLAMLKYAYPAINVSSAMNAAFEFNNHLESWKQALLVQANSKVC